MPNPNLTIRNFLVAVPGWSLERVDHLTAALHHSELPEVGRVLALVLLHAALRNQVGAPAALHHPVVLSQVLEWSPGAKPRRALCAGRSCIQRHSRDDGASHPPAGRPATHVCAAR